MADQGSGVAANVEESMVDVGGVGTFVRRSGVGGAPPTIFVHGNPDSSLEWLPFLARASELGGPVIAPDLPAFGRSERPPSDRFDSSLDAYDRWFQQLLRALDIDEYRLVVHDWGAVGLAGASHQADRVKRLVVLDAVPLHADYRWHWIARLVWRQPVIGELSMPFFGRFALSQLPRLTNPGRRRPNPAWVEQVVSQLDTGTKRAILALYRSADPEELARAGTHVADLSCPALVVWGEFDPYVGLPEGERHARTLPNARLRMVPGAGHWPWLEDPSLVDEVVAFLSTGEVV